jgi:sarcosine oxidase, subunit gamma
MTLKVGASMLEHEQPFASLPEGLGSAFADEPALRATPEDARFLLLQSRSALTLQEALTSEIGLDLPAPQGACVRGDYTLLWLTPAEWLLAHPVKETESLQRALTRRLTTSLAVVTDTSDAFAGFELSGARAAAALMGGCSLDLRPHALPPGRVARAALVDIPAIVWNPGGEPHRFRCLVDRSFASHLRDWLLDVTRGNGQISPQ